MVSGMLAAAEDTVGPEDTVPTKDRGFREDKSQEKADNVHSAVMQRYAALR